MENTKHSDPTALGLFGLAMVTLVASMQKFGAVSNTLFVLPWAVFLGAVAQLIAGVLDYKKGNIFGGLAFTAYGLFWLAVSLTWAFQNGVKAAAVTGDPKTLAFAYAGYFVFSVIMTIGSLTTNKVLTCIFILIDLLFLGLTLASLNWIYEFSHYLAAGAEFSIALLSFYACAANILNHQFKRGVLPIGKAFVSTVKE